ncbi:MAG: histidine phosphatase family protein [Rhodoblastus sp.]|uniref:histidine phosphatase family protein n=1 Tax=Rhodoblastus sp. TaxID=1962975 RepID=UPI003F9BE13F
MTTRLRLLCHASTSAVRNAAFPADEPLDDRAREKLPGLRHNLHHADRCFTSPALRAKQTAEAMNLSAIAEPLLRECDYGRWTGRALAEVQEEEPQAVTEWLQNPDASPHGGESILALMERVAKWLDAQKDAPGLTVAVTHASVIRAAIVHAIEAGPQSFWRIDVAPLSLTRLSGDRGRWTLASVGLMRGEAGPE